ncbi:MAG: hypothetical protein J6V63_01085 [Spirochaetaceae bacterium]|nr:hypothetical protein [Spirochaetaceae bacterium]
MALVGWPGTARTIPGQVCNPTDPILGCPFAHRCPYVMEKCSKSIPQMKEVVPGHKFRCWLEQ